MPSILRFFRGIFFYALYFLMCMVVVTVALQNWPVGGQMLFAFGVPVFLVWWQGRKRARKVLSKLDTVEDKDQHGRSPNMEPRLSSNKNARKSHVSRQQQVASPSQPAKLPKRYLQANLQTPTMMY